MTEGQLTFTKYVVNNDVTRMTSAVVGALCVVTNMTTVCRREVALINVYSTQQYVITQYSSTLLTLLYFATCLLPVSSTLCCLFHLLQMKLLSGADLIVCGRWLHFSHSTVYTAVAISALTVWHLYTSEKWPFSQKKLQSLMSYQRSCETCVI